MTRVLRRLGDRVPRQRLELGPNLPLELHRREAIVGGETVSLTPTESRLLYALAANLGQTVTTETLLARGWADTEDADPSYVWVTMRRLRQKVELDPNKPGPPAHGPGDRLPAGQRRAAGRGVTVPADDGTDRRVSRGAADPSCSPRAARLSLVGPRVPDPAHARARRCGGAPARRVRVPRAARDRRRQRRGLDGLPRPAAGDRGRGRVRGPARRRDRRRPRRAAARHRALGGPGLRGRPRDAARAAGRRRVQPARREPQPPGPRPPAAERGAAPDRRRARVDHPRPAAGGHRRPRRRRGAPGVRHDRLRAAARRPPRDPERGARAGRSDPRPRGRSWRRARCWA